MNPQVSSPHRNVYEEKSLYPVSITDQRQTVNMNDDMNNIEDIQ